MLIQERSAFDDTENRLNKGAQWAIVYGDFMSYMMIFFLMMFAYSINKAGRTEFKMSMEESLHSIQKTFGGRVDQDKLDLLMNRKREEDTAKLIQQKIDDARLNQFVNVDLSEEKVRITLQEPILFRSGSAGLHSRARKVLWNLTEVLRPLDNRILVEGHTDNVPIESRYFPSNWHLSQARAYSVVEFLLTNGVRGERLATVGYGEFQPVGDNASPEGRAKNRRIEISVLRTKKG